MKTILVPTDFSPTSDNALSYAAELNKKLNYEILLFHAYEVPMPVTDVPIITPDEEFREAAVKSLKQLSDKYKVLYPQMSFKTEVSMGNSNNEIVRMESKSDCSMVLMGTYGDNVMHHLMAGKHVAPVITRSNCPVVIIPKDAVYRSFDKMVFAVNFGADDLENSMQAVELAKKFNAELIILHIITKEKGVRHQYVEIEKFRDAVVEQSDYRNVNFKIMQHVDAFEGINAYLDEIKADMLVIGMRKRTMMDKIFGRSLTKKIAYHANKPLMVLHTALE